MPPEDEDEFLKLFDRLNLDQHAHRRMAAYALVDYYKSVLTQAGRANADLSEVHGKPIQEQWGNLTTRFAALDGFGDKEEYAELVYRVKGVRNDVAHNTLINPPREELEELREEADEWQNWINHWATEYEASKSDYSPRVLIIRMIENLLEDMAYTNIDLLEDKWNELQSEADDIRERLNEFERDGEITLELIRVFQRAEELYSDFQDLREEEAEFEMHLGDQRDLSLGR